MLVTNILRSAADLLEKIGWCQGYGIDPKGQRCAWSAMIKSAGCMPGRPSADLDQAREYFDSYLGGSTITGWNDQKGRTLQEVLFALRDASNKYIPEA